jgi:hypothetical protein
MTTKEPTMNYYSVTPADLLSYVNQYPYEATVELDGRDYDAACRATKVELSPLEDKIDKFDIEVLKLDDVPASYLNEETLGRVKAILLGHDFVRGECQCNVHCLLDEIHENSGFRGSLYEMVNNITPDYGPCIDGDYIDRCYEAEMDRRIA